MLNYINSRSRIIEDGTPNSREGNREMNGGGETEHRRRSLAFHRHHSQFPDEGVGLRPSRLGADQFGEDQTGDHQVAA